MIHTSIIWIREIILLAVGMRGIFIDVSRVIGLKKKRIAQKRKKKNVTEPECGLVPALGDPLPLPLLLNQCGPLPFLFSGPGAHWSGRLFRTPQEMASLKWLIIYHLSKPSEFC